MKKAIILGVLVVGSMFGQQFDKLCPVRLSHYRMTYNRSDNTFDIHTEIENNTGRDISTLVLQAGHTDTTGNVWITKVHTNSMSNGNSYTLGWSHVKIDEDFKTHFDGYVDSVLAPFEALFADGGEKLYMGSTNVCVNVW